MSNNYDENRRKEFITSIRTSGKFDTSRLVDEENIRKMNERIGENIAKTEQKILKGRDIVKKGNWIVRDDGEFER